MAKRVFANYWSFLNDDVDSMDETGAFLTIEYTCPKCGESSSDTVFIGSEQISSGALLTDFELDRTCEYCGKELIVVCEV